MPEAATDRETPNATMVDILAGFQTSQAAYVVAKLGVATVLHQEGPMAVPALAARTGAQAEALGRLIRTLTPLGLFTTREGRVAVTPLGATLSQEHPRSMYHSACMWMETHYLPFSELLHSVRTGRPGADRYLGQPFLSWVNEDARRAAQFSRAMAEVTVGLRAGMFESYQLPPGRVVADIGGADGSLLAQLLGCDGDTGRRGIVFDQPAIVATAERTVAAAGLGGRVEAVAGDFFVAVPAADIYLLAYVLHDWDDADSRRILGTIAASAPPGARLLVIEGLVPPDDEPHLTKTIDLTMLGMATGRERGEQEYRDLLESAGYTLDRVVPTATPFSIIEATPRRTGTGS